MRPSEISDAVVYIHTWPDHLVAPDLLLWLMEAGFRRERITFTRQFGRDVCTAMNASLRRAIDSRAPWAVFCDRDMRPTPRGMRPWLESDEFDVTCVKYPCETGAHAWGAQGGFHTGIWRARPADLARARMPVFGWPTNADGTALEGCNCQHAALRFREAGLTIGHAGACGHVPRGKDGLPETMHFGL